MAKKRKKVVKYKRRPQAAAVVFLIIIIYVACFIALYLSKSKVQVYEVNEGDISYDALFTGLAVRDETIYNSAYAGTINYYQHEGSRVKVGDTVYTVDETGRVSDILAQYQQSGDSSLSSENLKKMKTILNDFKTNYQENGYSSVYDVKDDLNSIVLDGVNESIMKNLSSIVAQTGSQNLFQSITTDKTGVIVYAIDGYEGISDGTVTSSNFNKSNYSKTSLKANSIVNAGDAAYKMINSEDWYLLIQLSQQDITNYNLASKSAVTINFRKDNITVRANFSIVNHDGQYYGKISLDKYMIRYCTDRFLDIELVASNDSGLKIPASAVTEQDFYTIPEEYLTTGGNSNSTGFICETYDTSGNATTAFQSPTIYKTENGKCYIKTDSLAAGTNIVKPNSSQRYVIGPTEKLQGVFCVNTGYTVFKLVDITSQNDEYVISKKQLTNGVSNYDRIVLDGSKYKENQLIY